MGVFSEHSVNFGYIRVYRFCLFFVLFLPLVENKDIGIGDGGKGALAPPPPKIGKNILFGQLSCKVREFCHFSVQSSCKIRAFC